MNKEYFVNILHLHTEECAGTYIKIISQTHWVGSCFFWDFSLSEFPPAEAQEKMS
jgi:hypothetical protein